MNKKDPALWAARRLHQILGDARRHKGAIGPPSLPALLDEQRLVERCWRMYHKAVARDRTRAAEVVLRSLVSHMAVVHGASRYVPPARQIHVSSLADIVAEIRHLQDEFDQVEINAREKRIEVTTAPITLEGVDLGAFCMQLHFDRLSRHRAAAAFVIIAKQSNPAAGDSMCTHPHVRSESLCAGDATAPIANALSEGRIGDAFQLVNRVLHTYNAGSAYVSLDDWDGQSCGDCGCTVASDSLYFCESCHSDFCDDCIRICIRCNQSV